MSAASSHPRTIPPADPSAPRVTACVRTNRWTWRRVVPAARSRPTSRKSSVTVIDSVLKIRNAPPNSETAAMSAVVAWKSAVDDRSDAARSAGVNSR